MFIDSWTAEGHQKAELRWAKNNQKHPVWVSNLKVTHERHINIFRTLLLLKKTPNTAHPRWISVINYLYQYFWFKCDTYHKNVSINFSLLKTKSKPDFLHICCTGQYMYLFPHADQGKQIMMKLMDFFRFFFNVHILIIIMIFL